jgi:hypothetical protein
MPESFWMELEAAYNAVAVNPSITVSVQRGDKTGTVKYNAEMDVIFIKIETSKDDTTANVGVEINPAAKKEVD